MKQDNKIREALEKAIKQVERDMVSPDPKSKADMAIQKLRKDRRLTMEELHRPTTI